jgi:ubiquinone/menaquinone biosynthesis C-methylase UbiE
MRSMRLISTLVLGLCLSACQSAQAPTETSVKPGINKDYLNPNLEVAQFEQRFEVESREIFAHRQAILELVGLREGLSVADVGAGTGLFSTLFATAVGPQGKVYAVDIVPRFVEHIRQLAKDHQQAQLVAVLCTERSVELAPNSVDVVFICDTYHHFEYPQSTLASIHRALKPGGALVLVDFIREVGVSRPWILEHVRAGQAQVRSEIEAAGFRWVRLEATPFLVENYMLRFEKR